MVVQISGNRIDLLLERVGPTRLVEHIGAGLGLLEVTKVVAVAEGNVVEQMKRGVEELMRL